MCLQCHSALYAGQELFLLPFATMDERSRLMPFEYMEGLVKNVVELGPRSFEGACDWIRALERRKTPTWRAYELLQELCAGRLFVDKTPHNADHPSFLEHAHAIFGRAARYCHLVRHPHACIASGLELRRETHSNPNVTWGEVEHAYVTLQRNVGAFLAARAHDVAKETSVRIRYEELLSTPQRTLTALCALMGLSFEPGMDEPYESAEVLASFQAASLTATTDPKLMRRKKIDAAQADKWRNVVLPQACSSTLVAVAKELGYEMM